MADKSAIEWTDATWNPIVGCSLVSPGCTNCYAMKMAARIRAASEARDGASHYCGTVKLHPNGMPVWTGKLAQAPDSILLAPLRRRKPTTYFVNSMGDLFHEDCPDEWIDRVFAVMALAPQHTFQVLTKRSERMREYFAKIAQEQTVQNEAPEFAPRRYDLIACEITGSPCTAGFIEDVPWPLGNVWLGVSTEDQRRYDERKDDLASTPAAVRFFSMEPLLGEIHMRSWHCACGWSGNESDLDRPISSAKCPKCQLNAGLLWDRDEIADWVIAGGESGPGARPMHPDWARSLRDQCALAGVPFFFKQWGMYVPFPLKQPLAASRRHFLLNGRKFKYQQVAGYALVALGKKGAGRKLDGIEHNAMPEVAR